MLVQKLIGSDRYSIKCPYTMSPKGLCIHNTANDASAENEVAYMKSNNNEVSFHVAVDDVQAIQAIPFNRNAWHSGDGGSGVGNRNYIAMEICYSKSGGTRFENAEKRAAKEAAAILKQYGWTIANIKKHQDFSNKYCPHRTLDLGWTRFLNMVQAELNALTGQVVTQEEIKVGSTVKVRGDYYATGQAVPQWVKANTYTVIEVSGTKALLGGIMSWVYIKDLVLYGAQATPVAPEVIAKNYLNLKPHMTRWAIYNENGPYTVAYKIGEVKPAQFGGLSYEILGNPMTDVYIISTRDYGRVGIWAPRDNDSTITKSPVY